MRRPPLSTSRRSHLLPLEAYDFRGLCAVILCDMILMPSDFQTCYQGVLDAVSDGTLSEERIDESVVRIVRAKLALES